MDTTTTSSSNRNDETKGYWVRRTVAPVGIAAGLALALALSACGTDTAVKHTSADAPTTTSVVEGDLDSPTSDLDSPSPTGGDVPTNPGGGQQAGQTGGQTGGQPGVFGVS